MPLLQELKPLLALAALACAAATAFAQEAVIRKALPERMPQLPPIDEVTRTPMGGVWEVRYGRTEILYSDDKGDYIFINGVMVDTRTGTDLTEARLNKVLAIDFSKLPLKDAVVIKQGTGARKLAVFADPNCGYCKRFERDLAGLKDVTIYTFVMPILGPDSAEKSRNVWCAKDSSRAWRGWMLNNAPPPKAAAACDAQALERNVAFAQTYRINGTPAVVFEDGTRKPGAMPAQAVEQLLVAAAAAQK